MSNDIIGIKLGVEGERDFKKALIDINQTFKVLGSEMQLVTSQFGKNEKSVGSLTVRRVRVRPLFLRPLFLYFNAQKVYCATINHLHKGLISDLFLLYLMCIPTEKEFTSMKSNDSNKKTKVIIGGVLLELSSSVGSAAVGSDTNTAALPRNETHKKGVFRDKNQ